MLCVCVRACVCACVRVCVTCHLISAPIIVPPTPRESSNVSQQVGNETGMTIDSSSRGQVKEVLWGYDDDDDDDMEL